MTKRALIVIDMQKAFFDAEPLKSRQPQLVQACNELIIMAHRDDIPVYTVRTLHSRSPETWTLNMIDDKKGFLFKDQEGSSYVDGLFTYDTTEIIKTRDSALWQTGLLTQLHQKQIDAVVLAGVSTHLCISSTAIDAYSANIRVELATDAIASHDPGLHETFLRYLQSEFRMKPLKNAEIAWK